MKVKKGLRLMIGFGFESVNPTWRLANNLPVLQWLGIHFKWVWGHGFFSDRACHIEPLWNPEKLTELLIGNNVAHLQ